MEQDEARFRLMQGATLLVLDVPTNFVLGIDGVCWTVGPLFKGLKMVPPGLHLVSFQYVVY